VYENRVHKTTQANKKNFKTFHKETQRKIKKPYRIFGRVKFLKHKKSD
jgi:hypothetical protein